VSNNLEQEMDKELHKADRHLSAARNAVTKLYLAFDPDDYCGDERMDDCAKRALDELTMASAELLGPMASIRDSLILPKPAVGFKWAVVMDEHDGTHPLQQRLDALGVAIADAGYAWTPAMRAAYEGTTHD
jgi:hypothetical protein